MPGAGSLFIGPYKVVRPIASGGESEVFEVEEPASGRHVALKRALKRAAAPALKVGELKRAAGPPLLPLGRALREFQVLRRLRHPNIIQVFDGGLDDAGREFLTMELLSGVSAQQHARDAGQPGCPRRNAAVVRVGQGVAAALTCLHNHGLVHQDVKSDNVLILQDGGVKLLDFGSAGPSGGDACRSARTCAYAAPEQLAGGQVGDRADVYAFGVLLYRLLTGQMPYEGTRAHELIRAHQRGLPAPPCRLSSGVPAPLSGLVLQMLARAPQDRPAADSVFYRLQQAPLG